MKKVNVSEANVIVGGTCKTCTVQYEYVQANKTCNAVSTCVDKNGKIVSTDSKLVDVSSCSLGQ
ncbi:TPA: DUF4762 family protein [Serratia fonticola]